MICTYFGSKFQARVILNYFIKKDEQWSQEVSELDRNIKYWLLIKIKET